jgi:hypothetical protein
VNLRSIDLNLLVILNALIEERSVHAAADCIDVSRSATSHALPGLRKLLDDPNTDGHGADAACGRPGWPPCAQLARSRLKRAAT